MHIGIIPIQVNKSRGKLKLSIIQTVHHLNLTLPPGKEEQGRAFYSGLLGLKELEKPDSLKLRGGIWFDAGPVQLHFSSDEADYRSKNRAHISFVVGDLAATREKLQGVGCKVEEAIEIPGFRRFYTRDPFGNRLEFMEANA